MQELVAVALTKFQDRDLDSLAFPFMRSTTIIVQDGYHFVSFFVTAHDFLDDLVLHTA
jgi:hypothetical protein